MNEIERKFLVINDSFKTEATKQYVIKQGYLNRNSERTVRVRTKNNKAFLTIKGKSNSSGTTRFEWENQIDINEALELLKLVEGNIIEKTRYIIPYRNHTFEVDIFEGNQKGLILAEIELKDENETFEKPSWLGKEVTGDVRYYNSTM
jgi:CYTH domain-containing protein